jgi:hypothetical protein
MARRAELLAITERLMTIDQEIDDRLSGMYMLMA